MAVLSKKHILERMKKGDVAFTPELDAFQLNSHSVDLRLGYTFLVPKAWHVTPMGRELISIDYLAEKRLQYFHVVELEQGQFFDIMPNEYVMLSTLESVKVPTDLMCILYPRSSVNRRGLSIDLTGIIDAGYDGQLVVPARNNTVGQVIRVYPGERFCQVVFEELTSDVPGPRKSRYHKADVIRGFAKEQSGTEVELVMKGEIKKLKADFPVQME